MLHSNYSERVSTNPISKTVVIISGNKHIVLMHPLLGVVIVEEGVLIVGEGVVTEIKHTDGYFADMQCFAKMKIHVLEVMACTNCFPF